MAPITEYELRVNIRSRYPDLRHTRAQAWAWEDRIEDPGIGLAVVDRRTYERHAEHFVAVPHDEELRRDTLTMLKQRYPARAACQDPDAVLVFAQLQ